LNNVTAVGNFGNAAHGVGSSIGDVGSGIADVGSGGSMAGISSGLAGFADSMENAEKSLQDLTPMLNQVAQAAGIDSGGRSLEDTIPLCKPWYMMGAVENFRDYLLTLQKQVWRLHQVHPSSRVVSDAFLDLTKAEYLIAPISGKHVFNRINAAEMEKVEQLREFLDADRGLEEGLEDARAGKGRATLLRSLVAAFAGVEQGAGSGMATGMGGGKLRSKAKMDVGYEDYNAKEGAGKNKNNKPSQRLENEIEIDEALALSYHDGNGSQGLRKVMLDTYENMRLALLDVHRAAEPCRLSNF